MIKKLTLLAGAGAGYVLGAKAGRERYEQIRRAFDDLRGKPKVQQATTAASEALHSTAGDLADKATGKVNAAVNEAVKEVKAKVTGKSVDLTDSPTGTPVPGAAPSMTAPDVPTR